MKTDITIKNNQNNLEFKDLNVGDWYMHQDHIDECQNILNIKTSNSTRAGNNNIFNDGGPEWIQGHDYPNDDVVLVKSIKIDVEV